MPGKRNIILQIRAWSVHFYTSLGLICGMYSLFAILSGDARTFFLFQGISLFIDATDGYFARNWKVKVWAPELDGRKLDDITDYINYAFLPIIFSYKFGIVNGPWTIVLGIVLIASVYGFCQNGAKTNDGYFTGFPNFWNILVFYLYFFNLSPATNSFVFLFFAFLIFVPIKYLSFSSPILRGTTYGISLLYGIVLLAIIMNFYTIDLRIIWLSMIAPLYYTLASLYLHLSNRTE